jgi:hypothetical protein
MARIVFTLEDGPNPYDDDLGKMKFHVEFEPKIEAEEFEQCLNGHRMEKGHNYCPICGSERGATSELKKASGTRLTAAQIVAKEIINLVTTIGKGKMRRAD